MANFRRLKRTIRARPNLAGELTVRCLAAAQRVGAGSIGMAVDDATPEMTRAVYRAVFDTTATRALGIPARSMAETDAMLTGKPFAWH